MDLKYIIPEVKYSVESIMEFTKPELPPFWSNPFFHFFPDIDRDYFNTLDEENRRNFLTNYFFKFENENKALLEEKLFKYNSRWHECHDQVVSALEDAFGIDLSELFNNMKCFVTYNPVSPRYLESCSFDVFYLNSENGALGSSLHEIIHFVWFYVWQNYFHDDFSEYETPGLKWILSEMVVETIMRDERLFSVNPYAESCVYPYFYTMKFGDTNILDILYKMFSSMSITDFMEESYRFCLEHESEIRAHIEKSENNS